MSNLESSVIHILQSVDEALWSKFLVFLLVGTGLLLTWRLRGMQFKYFTYSLKLAFTRQDAEAEGDISHFQALMTALAATIGIGSIAGVATAIVAGGFGAIFWMWVIALIGMATKFAEAILAVKFRIVDKSGQMCGGPMYYIQQGLGWKGLAMMFAACGAFSAFFGGNMTQSNSIAAALQELFLVPPLASGIILTAITIFVVMGGIKSIGKVSSYLVPIMALMYVSGGLIILVLKAGHIPHALKMIFLSAFNGQAAIGGFLGASVMAAVQMGVARGVSSNEAGLGSAPIAAAAAKTDVPGRQALISMTGVFLSSFVVCTITALVLSVTDVLGAVGGDGRVLNGAALVMHAFRSVIPGGSAIVALGIVLFGYTTIVGWAYYGERCITFLAGEKALKPYRIVFCAMVLLGALLNLDIVWPLVDIANGLMALPNLIAICALAGVVTAESRSFFKLVESERLKVPS